MLDINLFREYKGGNPDLIRESQRRRHKDVGLVDAVISLDEEWRKLRGRLDTLNKYLKDTSSNVGKKMKAKEAHGDADQAIPAAFYDNLDEQFTKENINTTLPALTINQLKSLSGVINERIVEQTKLCADKETERDKALIEIGNIVHESVPISDNEDNNAVIVTIGEKKPSTGLLNHVDIMSALGCLQTIPGTKVAGGRAYFVTGDLVRMNLALQQYGLDFLCKRGYSPIYPPYFMNTDAMAKVAQLSQFDDELYKVTGEGDDKYLIATSEQPIAAYHAGEWIEEKNLPIKLAGVSTCFRKEVGTHGKDTLGIFRVHQFEKIEQFVVTSPKDNKSWDAMDDMIQYSREFYDGLGLPYQVVCIVSGALNNAAAKKLDLEAWFPASQKYRELVSCSNCTDYQSRRMETRYVGTGTGATSNSNKEYVHMLNSTLTATTRTMCCIVENYQTPEGINVPEVLQPYMGGVSFIPFKPKEVTAKKESSKKK
ncbi:seryl tRS [Acrasis kona]|uniref:serine--tRNA ligase n=1 Tax=Acrasis kona TaxID=1008807 RepID=A0AAW2Z5E6_9EUKA